MATYYDTAPGEVARVLFRVSVLYASADTGARDGARRLAAALPGDHFRVRVKPVTESTIADVAAADLCVLATGAELGTEFDDLVRAFAGINLAGRMTAFLYSGSKQPALTLQKALADSDAVTVPPVAAESPVDGWVDSTVKKFEELMRSRDRWPSS